MAEKAKKKKAAEPKATTPWGKAMLSDFDEAAPWNDPALRPPKPKPTPKFVPAPTTETEPFVSGPDRAFSRADEIRQGPVRWPFSFAGRLPGARKSLISRAGPENGAVQ